MVANNKNSTTIKFSASKKDQKGDSKENIARKSESKSDELLETIVDNTSNQNKKLDTIIEKLSKVGTQKNFSSSTETKSDNTSLSNFRKEIEEDKLKASKIDLEKKRILAELAIQAAKKRNEVQMNTYDNNLKKRKEITKRKTTKKTSSSSTRSKKDIPAKSQIGGPTSSTILSMLTGGAINPVIANAFGLDKLFMGGVAGTGRLIKKGGAKIGAGLATMAKIWDNNSASENETNTTSNSTTKKSDKKDSSSSTTSTKQDKNRKEAGIAVQQITDKPKGKLSDALSKLTQPIFKKSDKKEHTTSIFDQDEKTTVLQRIANDLNSIKKFRHSKDKDKSETDKKPGGILSMLGKSIFFVLGGLGKLGGMVLKLIPGGILLLNIFKTIGVVGRVVVNLLKMATPALVALIGVLSKFTSKGLVKAGKGLAKIGKLAGKGISKGFNKVKDLAKGAKTSAKASSKASAKTAGKAAPKAKASPKASKGVADSVKKAGKAKASSTVKTPLKATKGKAIKKAASLTSKAGAKTLAKAGGKTAGKVAGKSIGKSILKKIPGIGLATGLFFGAKRAMAGDWQGAMGEFASGAASTIPGFGTAISAGLDLALAARDMSLSDAATGGETLNTSNLTDKAYKLQTENVMSEQTLLQQASSQRQEQQNKQLQEQISNTTNNNSTQSIINNTNITSKESTPVYATGDCATTLYNNY